MNDFPKLALGTWLMGGTKDPDPNNDDASDINVIKLAIDNDITLIDTAQNYAMGRCEELVGIAINPYHRENVQILTKQSRLNLKYDEVLRGCQDSLARLGIDTIDYFVCHAPNPDEDLSQFFKACNQLRRDGLIKNVGVSNFGPKALAIALDTSNSPICLNQVSFSLNSDDIVTTGTHDFCIKNNIPLQAYRPLKDLASNEELINMLTKIATKYHKTAHQIALTYLNSFEGMNFTIRASTKEHWDQVKEAMTTKLEDSDHQLIATLHKNKSDQFAHFLNI